MRSPRIGTVKRAALLPALALLFALAPPGHAAGGVALRWQPAVDLIAPGETATVSVVLDDPIDVRTIDVVIDFDPAKLQTLSCVPGALFGSVPCYVWPAYEESTAGRWHAFAAIIGAACKTTGPGELLRWSARGLTAGWSSQTTVAVTLWDPAANRYQGVTLANGQIHVASPSGVDRPPGPLRLELAPNPFNPGTSVRWTAPAGIAYRLELFDTRGQRLALLAEGTADGGDHATVWAGRDDSGRAVPSGVYLFRLSPAGRPPLLARGVLLR